MIVGYATTWNIILMTLESSFLIVICLDSRVVIYDCNMFIVQATLAFTIKPYEFVIYGKWADFVVSQYLFFCQSRSLVHTNTQAYLTLPNLF